MTKKMGYRWHLRRHRSRLDDQLLEIGEPVGRCVLVQLDGRRGDLRLALLRLRRHVVEGDPYRRLFGCGVQDLIEVIEVNEQVRKNSAASGSPAPRARKTTIRRP